MTEWQLLETFFEKGLPLSHEDRLKLLETLPSDKAPLRAEIQALWEHSHDEEDFEALPQLSFQHLERYIMQRVPQELEIPGFVDCEPLAKGSTSTVYRAQQLKPKREVALKVLHCHVPSMDETARFELEQQALASLAHPNIATVFDAGVTPQGYPYFVMEFLDGMPLTQYCDQNQLGIHDRLLLFLNVCDAVMHAHQKQIIHRDLKPGNILVVQRDGKAVPKIIDFGVAKLKEGEIPAPFLTRAGMVIGTPAYMSPEQASGRRPDEVDTRADVYALGVLLFELLVGTPPLAEKLVQAGSVRAMCSLIERAEPVRASVWLRKAQGQEEMAGKRQLKVENLIKTLTQDLDWILLKALAKDPFDRYQAVSELSHDLHHHLGGFPVNARPPGSLYLLKKLIERHKRMTMFLSLVSAMLIIGYGGTVWGFIQTKRAERRAQSHLAEVNAIVAFNSEIFSNVGPFGEGYNITGKALLDIAATKLKEGYSGSPAIEVTLRQQLARSYKGLGFLDQAAEQYQLAYRTLVKLEESETPKALKILNRHAYIAYLQGRYDDSEHLIRSAIDAWVRYPNFATDARSAQVILSLALGGKGEREASKQIIKDAIQLKAEPDDHDIPIYNNYALLLRQWGEVEEAKKLLDSCLEQCLKFWEPEDPRILSLRHNQALLITRSNPKEAEKIYLDVLSLREKVLGPLHYDTLHTRSNLADFVGSVLGQKQRALDIISGFEGQVLNGPPTGLPITPIGLELAQNIGHYAMEVGDFERADKVLRKVIEERRKMFGVSHPKTFNSEVTLAENFFYRGQRAIAMQELEAILEHAEEALGSKHPTVLLYKRIYNNFKAAMIQPAGN